MTKHKKEHNILLFYIKKILMAIVIFAVANDDVVVNDDADAEIPIPRFPNGLDKKHLLVAAS